MPRVGAKHVSFTRWKSDIVCLVLCIVVGGWRVDGRFSIMNKGPPAGNVLRKQVSLLPKYQLTITPIDNLSVRIQLVLLNQTHLLENMEHLTAGVNHKSYIVIGNSENDLLLLTSFKDKDIISVYDGTISYEVTRKHSHEHKLIVHCISSNFVGIDTSCEYLFKDLTTSKTLCTNTSNIETKPNPTTKPLKQTFVTDVFPERKRKTTSSNLEYSKEKKKRDCSVIKQFKSLKDTFDLSSNKTIKEINKEPDKSTHILRTLQTKDDGIKTLNEIKNNCKEIANNTLDIFSKNENNYQDVGKRGGDFLNDEQQINNILNKIENEIRAHDIQYKSIVPTNQIKKHSTGKNNKYQHCQAFKNKGSNNNYNSIKALEQKNKSDDEDDANVDGNNTFTDTIKNQINNFLAKTKDSTRDSDINISNLLEIKECELRYETNNKVEEIKATESAVTLDHITKNTDSESKNITMNEKETSISPKENVNKKNSILVQNEIYPTIDARDYINSPNITINCNIVKQKHTPCVITSVTKDKNTQLTEDNYYLTNNIHCSPSQGTDMNEIDRTTNNNNNIKHEDKIVSMQSFIHGSILTESDHRLTNIKKYQKNGEMLTVFKNEVKSLQEQFTCIQTVVEEDIDVVEQQYSISRKELNVYTEKQLQQNNCVIKKLQVYLDIRKLMIDTCKNENKLNVDAQTTSNKGCKKENREKIENDSKKRIANDAKIKTNVSLENSNILQVQNIQKAIENESFQNDFVGSEEDQRANKTIFGIIHKYKDMSSKKSNTTSLYDSNTDSQFSQRIKLNVPNQTEFSKLSKIKRKYKIRDLPNLQYPSNSKAALAEPLQIPIYCKSDTKQYANTLSNNTMNNNNDLNSNFEDISSDRVTDGELSITLSPACENRNDQLEKTQLTANDFHISASMFNPKALIECLKEDDHILPPPPDFRDKRDLFSLNDEEKGSQIEHFAIPNEFGNFQHNDSITETDQDINIFEGNQYGVLTPNKEIETWTLSVDDQDPLINTNPYTSLTVMRNNNTTENLSLKLSALRQEKLNRFKCMRKKYLTFRK